MPLTSNAIEFLHDGIMKKSEGKSQESSRNDHQVWRFSDRDGEEEEGVTETGH